MSAKIMGQVWDLKLSPAERTVLLAMADHADHEGNNVRPSIGLIAWKTDYSERQVKRIIKDLRTAGLLIMVQDATPTTPIHYRINIAAGIPKEPYKSSRRGDILTPRTGGDILSRGDIAMSPGGCHSYVTPRGDIAMSPKPSIEPSINQEDRAPRKARAPHTPKPKEKTPHQAIMDAYADVLGYPIPDGPTAGAGAKKLVSMGYTPEQVTACYAHLKAQSFYRDKHISLQIVAKNIGAYLQAKNGSYTNGTRSVRSHAGQDPERAQWTTDASDILRPPARHDGDL